MSAPIAIKVTRYRCPHCARSHSSRRRAVEHIGRCWRNPAARGCKTCRFFDATYEDYGEDCELGVDLTGRPACEQCGGQNFIPTSEVFRPSFAAPGRVMAQCPACGGNGTEVKPGPIIHCDKWESAQRSAEGAPKGDDHDG